MKRVTVPFLKKTIVLLIGVLLALTVVSCEYININIQDLVVEKLDNAVIEEVVFNYGINTNRDGQDCIFSNYYGGYKLSGIIRNPRGYNLIVRYEMTDGTTVTQATYNSESEYRDALINSEPPTAVSFVMDGNSGFSMYLSNTFLRTRELNLSKRNIGGTLTLKDIAGGREFEPYSFALRVNSSPESPYGTMLQRNGAGTEYILCFNMPTSLLTDEVMFDTHVIDINGMKRYFKSYEDFDGHFYTDAAMTNVDPSFTMERPEDLRPLKDDGDLFEESDWAVSVYYYTRVAETREDKTWTLFIEDDEGLKSDTDYACNNEKTLSNPWFDIATDARVDVNDDGIYIMKVYHNGKCLDGADVGDYLYIHYTLIDQNGEIETGRSACWDRGDGMYAEIELNINIYREITVWAKAQHHTPSDHVSIYNVTVKRPPELYVSNSGKYWNTGAKNNPLRTINQAIENFLDGDAEEYRNETTFKIYLLDDITPEDIKEGDYVTIPKATTDDETTVKTFNIIGYEGNRTIDAKKNLDAPGSVIRVNSGAKLTMRNITITGGYAEDGGGLAIEGGANVSLANCTITENTAGYCGGGIIVSQENITFLMNGCTVSDNISSDNGGGMFVMNTNGTVTINNSTFSGNIVDGSADGGGIHIWQGPVELNACTFSGNSASKGGAIALRNQESASLKLDGATSIPAGTDGNSGYNDIYVEDGKSIEIGSNFTYSGAQALIDFYTYTQNATVFTGYPAKASGKFKPENAGFIITSEGKLSIDPDIYVNSSSSSPAGSPSGNGSQARPYDSLTDAFNRIKTLDEAADYIIHVSGTISHSNGLSITRSSFGTNAPSSITIQGTNPENDKLSRGANSRSTVAIDGSVTFPVIFENLTITGGNAYGNGNNGGGLSLALDTNVTLKNCIVTGNSTDTSSGGLGGGIYVNGNLTLDGTSVTGNTSTVNGGGIYVASAGTLNVKGKVIINNNTSNSAANNVYLSNGKFITVDGALDPTSRIGVTTQTDPSPGTNITFSNGVSNSGLTADQLSAVFASDGGYTVLTSNGECKLAVSGGSYSGGTMPNSNLTFAFTDAATNGNTVTSFYAGYAKDIYITVYEPGANDPIPASSIECTVELKSGARTFSPPGCTTVGNAKKITLPSTLYPDNYRLYVTVAYNGFTYDCSYPLEGIEPDLTFTGTSYTVLTGADATGSAGTSGTYVLFGDWPQTIKAANVTIEEGISKQVGAFTYYMGSDGAWYAKQQEKAYTSGYKYSDDTDVAQGGTSYKYFKVKPIKWRVLTTDYNGTGKKLLFAEDVLINYRYAASDNNYVNSEIRSYINGDFYNTAFSSMMQSKIVTMSVDNSVASTGDSSNSYVCEDTNDNVFLLSYTEATNNTYGLNNNDVRTRRPTDFALASGTYTYQSGSYWWSRSPRSNYSNKARIFLYSGGADGMNVFVDYVGVVPALCLDN
ncbi:MAG: right-handed parallel beta-helix repeat-containing protein [Spirochaetaceae bacterium]|nr:right-handed parallel beta-helix repeat-containing protein [Spirochaetaceae bacterium]